MLKKYRDYRGVLLRAGLMLLVPMLVSGLSAYAQGPANSISGGVFGLDRTPIADAYVELLDEYGGSIQRSRTNGSGRYLFHGMAGNARYAVRILPFGTDYEEQEQEVFLQNFKIGTSTSSTHEQLDFYLHLRKGVDPTMVGVIFAQEIPPKAQKLYEQALDLLSDKKQKEAFEALKAAIDLFPSYFLALDRLGKEYTALGSPAGYEASAILLNMAVGVNSRSSGTWYTLAYSLYNLKRYDEAGKAVAKSLEINSGGPEALLLSGVLKRYDKKFEEAEKLMLKAKEAARDRLPQVHWELALLYANDLNRYADAAKELKAYMKVEKNIDQEKIKKLIADMEAKAAKAT
jgi:tetratricopeptide (TPR) repeat protein